MFKNKDQIKSEINYLFEKVEKSENEEQKVREIRQQIIKLLEDTINFLNHRNEFDLWAKDSLAAAISWLSWNQNKEHVTTMLLCACIYKIELALTECSERSIMYPHNKKRTDDIDQLEPKDYLELLSDLKRRNNVV